jgi:hypothetical protein
MHTIGFSAETLWKCVIDFGEKYRVVLPFIFTGRLLRRLLLGIPINYSELLRNPLVATVFSSQTWIYFIHLVVSISPHASSCKSFNADETEGKIEKLQNPNDNKHIKRYKLSEISTFGCQNQKL